MTTDEAFIAELRAAILGDALNLYLKMIGEKKPATVQDAGWRAFIEWVQTNGPQGMAAARAVIRQVMCDTMSNTLAVFDGSSNLATMREDIVILYGGYDGQEIQDNLTDYFWEQELEEEEAQN